jgi:hypothetical protein
LGSNGFIRITLPMTGEYIQKCRFPELAGATAIDSIELSTDNHELPFEERRRIIDTLIDINEIEDILACFNKNVDS